MKLLTLTVPCYNSQNYMDKAIASLLVGGDRVEIIIIDDGSTDKTGEIADGYAERYPNVVKVVHQENGGHGEGINQGVARASGKYFYVVDSDDWLYEEAYLQTLDTLEELEKDGGIDLYVANFVYAHDDAKKDQAIRFANVFPEDKIISWQDTNPFLAHQCLTIHTCIFRTDVIRESGLVMPKHVFYEDNMLVYIPLPLTKKLYYANVDLYGYFIGREDQSIQESVIMKRCLQQKLVSEIIATSHNLTELKKTSPKLAHYMRHEAQLLLTIATVFMRLHQTDEMEKANDEMWQKVIDFDPKTGKHMKNRSICWWATRRGKFGNWLCRKSYHFSQSFVHYN